MKRGLALALLTGCLLVSPAMAADGDYWLYVGSYTDAPSTAKGIYAWRWSPRSDDLTRIGLVAPAINPAYVDATPDGRALYAVNWQTPSATTQDTVSAYTVNRATGALTLLNKVASGGGLPNEVVVGPGGRFVAVTNYGARGLPVAQNNAALAVLPVEADGRLDAANRVDHYSGPALSPTQVAGAHTHGIIFTPDNKFAFVAELGLDRIYSYRVDGRTLTPLAPAYINTSAGAGPRRLAISHDGKFLYVNHETDSKVSVFAVAEGHLTEVQQISTLPPDFKGRNSTAEIQLDPQGRFLYVSNRGDDSIMVFAVDAATGKLSQSERVPVLGKTPRNIRIDPTGTYLFVANQGSDGVAVFKRDANTGHLLPTGQELKLGQPGGMVFVKAGQ